MSYINRVLYTLLLLSVLVLAGCGTASVSSAHSSGSDHDEQKVFVMNISINPEIELSIDVETGLVVSVSAVNEDARKLIEEGKLDLIGWNYDAAAETIITACREQGYLNSDNHDIRITLSGHEHADKIMDEYNDRMKFVFEYVSEQTDFELAAQMDCISCHGTGECDLCNGRKTIECDVCSNGESESNDNEICDLCGGEGTLLCEECEGNGEYPCEHCSGEGKVTC